MRITIRTANKRDLKNYTDLLQRTYEEAYTNKKLGLGKELFSKVVFNSPDTQKYLLGNLEITDKQKTWLAFDDKKLVGSVTVADVRKKFDFMYQRIGGEKARELAKPFYQKALSELAKI